MCDVLLKIRSLFFSAYYSFEFKKKVDSLYAPSRLKIIGGHFIHFSGKANFGYRCWLECVYKYRGFKYTPCLKIGNNVSFGNDCHIGCCNYIEIGDNCLIGSKVMIEDHYHGNFSGGVDSEVKKLKPLYSKGAIIIGKNVWIGESVSILPNVKIGDNSIIGAGSIVTHDIESNSIYAGNPAKKIR